MTLMPVTRISAEPACSEKVGASRWIDGHVFVADRAGFVDRLADHVHDAAQGGGTDRHADGRAGVDHFLAADQAFGGVHGDGAHGVLAQMLGHFEHQADFLAGAWRRCWWFPARSGSPAARRPELDVDDGADHLEEAAFGR